MGTGERSIASAKPSKTPTSTAPPANPPPRPPPPPPPPPVHSDGSASAQAIYGGGAATALAEISASPPPPAVSFPYPWGSQVGGRAPLSVLKESVVTQKKNIGKTFQDGGNMQHIGSTQCNNTTAESSYSAASLTLVAGQKGRLPKHHWMLDEHELKKQRRKQLNRESARRSRLRKQQQYQDLARRVDMLNSENCALRRELEQLDKHCKELDSENASIAEELSKIFH